MLMSWTLLELYSSLRQAELSNRRTNPVPPASAHGGWRRRLAGLLVAAGLRLDAEATRATLRMQERSPRLNGSDA